MKILLTGATGYIGKRLLPVLVQQGHEVVCCVRDRDRFSYPHSLGQHVKVLEMDLLDAESLKIIPEGIDAAYYLVHSMSSVKDYQDMEERSARNFREAMNRVKVRQVIYLSGIVNEKSLSKHLASRSAVENELGKGKYSLTTLRAGIIIGSGSASFEIMRDLVEKLPIMVAPKWLLTKCQPVGITDVIEFLTGVLMNEETFDQNFDIGGPDILNYKQMLLQLAEVRQLKRRIYIVPVMTPRLSSYWLYFVTSTSYRLAVALVDSMKIEVVCRDTRLNDILGIQPQSYKDALKNSFHKIEGNEIISSWKDAMVNGRLNIGISDFVNVPQYGCFQDIRERTITDRDSTIDKVWRIGGTTGWYYANFLWRIRGVMDKMVGGVGLRRGRTNAMEIKAGDALDFWRVLYANKEEGRLLLFAEMRLPGEAWLEFRVEGDKWIQAATFRPKGLAGRLYWFSVYPFHGFIFKGMLKNLTT